MQLGMLCSSDFYWGLSIMAYIMCRNIHWLFQIHVKSIFLTWCSESLQYKSITWCSWFMKKSTLQMQLLWCQWHQSTHLQLQCWQWLPPEHLLPQGDHLYLVLYTMSMGCFSLLDWLVDPGGLTPDNHTWLGIQKAHKRLYTLGDN